MGLYNSYILPRVTHCVCNSKSLSQQRHKIIPLAKGKVLEIGIGSGLNFPIYDIKKVKHIYGLDPSLEMLAQAKKKAKTIKTDTTLFLAYANDIPLDDNSIDCVVSTYTLCTVSDLVESFAEIKRVLKTGGELLFCEHGCAADRKVQRIQSFLNPLWKSISGGCQLNKKIDCIIQSNGFEITSLEKRYISGLKFVNYNYWGKARIN